MLKKRTTTFPLYGVYYSMPDILAPRPAVPDPLPDGAARRRPHFRRRQRQPPANGAAI